MNKYTLLALTLSLQSIFAGSYIESLANKPNDIKITIATKQATEIYVMPATTFLSSSCHFENINKQLSQKGTPKDQRAYVTELLNNTECRLKKIGESIKGKPGLTVKVPRNDTVIFVNRYGAKACLSNKDVAVRTKGKSRVLNKLSASLASGGSEIYCDYDPRTATVADKKVLNDDVRNDLQSSEYGANK